MRECNAHTVRALIAGTVAFPPGATLAKHLDKGVSA